jgi:hypothetical protein
MTTVSCPGCGKRVVPTVSAPPDTPAPTPGAAETGERWSFIWRPPSGMVCPECFFPLSRYARRLKWVRVFSGGLALLVAALMLTLLWMFSPQSTWPVRAARIVALVGAAVLLVGAGGIVIGGRRRPDDQAPTS